MSQNYHYYQFSPTVTTAYNLTDANVNSLWATAHLCWCCRCEQWCQSEAESSPSPQTPCRHLGNSRPGWLSGNCDCVIGSMSALADPEAPSCPENGSGNP